MGRTWLRLILDVLLTIAGALVVLGIKHSLPDTTPVAAGFAEGARRLFLFMDIGLGVWVIWLSVFAVRQARGGPALGRVATLIGVLVGVVVNLATVIVVGFAQTGAFPAEFVGYAVEAGIATLLIALAAVALVHRLLADRRPVTRR